MRRASNDNEGVVRLLRDRRGSAWMRYLLPGGHPGGGSSASSADAHTPAVASLIADNGTVLRRFRAHPAD